MGPESGYCEFRGEINARVGDTIPGRDHLSGDENENGLSQLYRRLSCDDGG